MRYIKSLFFICILCSLGFVSSNDASTVRQFNLDEMTTNAGYIFRGEVTAIKNSSVYIGGGNLATTTYVFQVSDQLKGEIVSKNSKANNQFEITMLGSIKPVKAKDGIKFVGGFTPPILSLGKEYLLFTTTPSSAGLSMTVGMGQGVFQFMYKEQVMNESMNSGLFRGMTDMDMPASGPISYAAVSQHVREMLGTNGGSE